MTAADGAFAPMQLVFQGTTERCLVDVKHLLETDQFQDWDFTYTSNHWSSEVTMRRYFEKVLDPW